MSYKEILDKYLPYAYTPDFPGLSYKYHSQIVQQMADLHNRKWTPFSEMAEELCKNFKKDKNCKWFILQLLEIYENKYGDCDAEKENIMTLKLIYRDGLTAEQVAERMNCDRRTVFKRKDRGMTIFAQYLFESMKCMNLEKKLVCFHDPQVKQWDIRIE